LINDKSKPCGNVDGATSRVTSPPQDEVTILDEPLNSQQSVVTSRVTQPIQARTIAPPREARSDTTKADLENPVGIEKFSGDYQGQIMSAVYRIRLDLESRVKAFNAQTGLDYQTDYSNLPRLEDFSPRTGYSEYEAYTDYINALENMV